MNFQMFGWFEEYSAFEFINSFSSTIGNENRRIRNIISTDQINLDPEDSESSSDEEPTDSRRHVCLQNRSENFALLHEDFAHGGFCESCAKTLQQLKHECPICSGIIVGIMRVFCNNFY